MGTPEFAVPSLDILIKNGWPVVGVVTAPDKPSGRGLKLQQSAVKEYAVANDLPVLQPPKLRDPGFLEELRALGADLQVVVAFRMLPEVVWAMPRLGTINLHGSLLPQYRGAAPINWAIINGEKETGVTTFLLQQEIDTGSMLFQERMPIRRDETAGELHDEMMHTGAKLLLKTVEAMAAGGYTTSPQPELPESQLKRAPKLFKEDGKIDWQQDTAAVYNRIRGLGPYPGAWTWLQDKTLKIFRAEKERMPPRADPGAWDTDYKSFLRFACADGWIRVLEVQLEGKKRMPVGEFLRGYRRG
ncbi:methionyl-tRNA formyltransferase [Compostibacter hankyongensis]|uniref:Methionyl-tRNA formyltransferase n=2 Tax=Compostibacter hankyongensis TaxID=1007089 RepID=A0ABP8G4C2_9BACT